MLQTYKNPFKNPYDLMMKFLMIPLMMKVSVKTMTQVLYHDVPIISLKATPKIGIIEDDIYPDPLVVPSDGTLEPHYDVDPATTTAMEATANPQLSMHTTNTSCFHSSIACNNTQGQNWELEQSSEISTCEKFAHETCGCKLANGKPCSTLFDSEYYIQLRSQASLLTREQLDMVLLGLVMSTVKDSDVVAGRHKAAKRQRTTINFMHKGYHLCRTTFTFLYSISKHRLKGIKDSFLKAERN